MDFYYGVNPSEKRVKLMKSQAAKPFTDGIIKDADEAVGKDFPALKMSDYTMFYENGNRIIFEKGYFQKRRKCSNIMMAYWLTEDEKYLMPLVDYINYICDEYTWCLPAHSDLPERKPQSAVEHVDLFQAETARLFAEIVMCVGDKLPKYTLDRMHYEINRRIFPKFDRGEIITSFYYPAPERDMKYFWEYRKMNWATVCSAGCVMAVLYFGNEEQKNRHIKRLINCLDNYLEGIEDDGCCQEGMAYWRYGFTHFLIFAQALKVYTKGEIDYLKNPKVKKLALFPQKVRMSDSKVVSFSDAGEKYYFNIGPISFLKSMYDEVVLPDLKYGSMKGNVDSACELLWFDENYKSEGVCRGTDYFENACWYISKNDKFSFAAKGGHNDEPHNHNDVGSFMITVGEETFLADLGCGEYVKETFMYDKRYLFLETSSRGHSVPIINGEYQHEGAEYRAKNVRVDGNVFEMDMEDSYTKGIVERLNRRFEVKEDGVLLVDTLYPNEKTESFVERFVSKLKPEICDGFVDYGVGQILFDQNKYNVSVGTEIFSEHNTGIKSTVYLVDFEANDKSDKTYEFKLQVK